MGNGRLEQRTYDRRYEPTGIETVVTASPSTKLLSWGYTVDPLGDIVAINDTLNPAMSRSFGYQRHQRFLTCAAGPWVDSGSCDPPSGGRLEWTYDRIGNRLTEVKTGTGGYSDAYLYVPNSSSGNTSLLDRIERGGGLLRDYTFDSGGFLDSVTAGANSVDLTFDSVGQLSRTERPVANERMLYFYDGSNFLAEAKEPPVPPCPSGPSPIFCDAFETSNLACWSEVSGGSSGGNCPWQQGGDRLTATYSSEGVLFGLSRFPQGQPEEKLAILRFGDRPVAIWRKVGSNPASLTYLTTDHLGTPVLAMSSTGTAVWSGGFEPFGRDFTVPSAESLGVFLRLPGQWEDPVFDPSTLGVNLHYNLHRWYEPGTGRYIAPDPFTIGELRHGSLFSEIPVEWRHNLAIYRMIHPAFESFYGYSASNPGTFVDPDGRASIGGLILQGLFWYGYIKIWKCDLEEAICKEVCYTQDCMDCVRVYTSSRRSQSDYDPVLADVGWCRMLCDMKCIAQTKCILEILLFPVKEVVFHGVARKIGLH